MRKIKVVELFAGVGGFRLGLEAISEQFEVIWANQWEPHQKEQFAFSCYCAHFGSAYSSDSFKKHLGAGNLGQAALSQRRRAVAMAL